MNKRQNKKQKQKIKEQKRKQKEQKAKTGFTKWWYQNAKKK